MVCGDDETEKNIITQHFILCRSYSDNSSSAGSSWCSFIKCVQWKLFGDSQVIVKVTGEDTSSAPTVCRVLQLNWASVSSFSAEYSSMEEVVERPVAGSTSTEAWMEIPGQENKELCLKTLNKDKSGAMTKTLHSHCQRVQHNSSLKNNLQSRAERINTFVNVIFIKVRTTPKSCFVSIHRHETGWWIHTFSTIQQRFVVL